MTQVLCIGDVKEFGKFMSNEEELVNLIVKNKEDVLTEETPVNHILVSGCTISAMDVVNGDLKVLNYKYKEGLDKGLIISGPDFDGFSSVNFNVIVDPETVEQYTTKEDSNGEVIYGLNKEQLSLLMNNSLTKYLQKLFGDEFYSKLIGPSTINGLIPGNVYPFKGSEQNQYNKHYLGFNYCITITAPDFSELVDMEYREDHMFTELSQLTISVKEIMGTFNVEGKGYELIKGIIEKENLDDWSRYNLISTFSETISNLIRFFKYEDVVENISKAIQEVASQQDLSETLDEVETLEETRSPE